MDLDEKYIQIMPVDKMYALYKDDNGDKYFLSPIICLALTNDGNIEAIDFDPLGFFCKTDSANNFVKYVISRMLLRCNHEMTREELLQYEIEIGDEE